MSAPTALWWTETVPKDWAVLRNAALFDFKDVRGRTDLPVLAVSIANGVYEREFSGDRIQPQLSDYANYKIAQRGDIVFNKMRMWQGAVGVAPCDGLVSPDYTVLRPRTGVASRYYHLLFKTPAYLCEVDRYSHGMVKDRNRIYWQEFKCLRSLVPSVQDQERITAFLDRKTASIDALIEKKERLVALMTEKRAALIHQAVTKGLDPNVPMKPVESGFFSECPADWTFLRLKFLVRDVKDGPHYSPPYVSSDDGFMFLSARNVKVDGWSLGDARYVSPELFSEFSKKIRPQRGDVLYTKGGTTGVARAVDFDTPFQVWVHVAVLKVKSDVVPEYLAHALNSAGCYAQAQLYTRGATNSDLGLTRMINIEFPWPRPETQAQLVEHLDGVTGKADRTKCLISDQITRLREYREALITAAVTGQLEIPEEAA